MNLISKVPGSVNLIGEKNLEYEVKQNFCEVKRLISLLNLTVNLRFAHDITRSDIDRLPLASVNILREPVLSGVGDHLHVFIRDSVCQFISTRYQRDPVLHPGYCCHDQDYRRIKRLIVKKNTKVRYLNEFSDLRGARVRCEYSGR